MSPKLLYSLKYNLAKILQRFTTLLHIALQLVGISQSISQQFMNQNII